jgi:hypothetical protein
MRLSAFIAEQEEQKKNFIRVCPSVTVPIRDVLFLIISESISNVLALDDKDSRLASPLPPRRQTR